MNCKNFLKSPETLRWKASTIFNPRFFEPFFTILFLPVLEWMWYCDLRVLNTYLKKRSNSQWSPDSLTVLSTRLGCLICQMDRLLFNQILILVLLGSLLQILNITNHPRYVNQSHRNLSPHSYKNVYYEKRLARCHDAHL